MWGILLRGVWLTALSVEDVRQRRISLWQIVMGIPLVVWSQIQGAVQEEMAPGRVLCWLLPGVILLVMALTKKVGYGDGAVLLLLGLMERDDRFVRLFLCSMLLMSVVSVFLLILRRAGKETRLPYLPFLLVAWLMGRRIAWI